MVSAYIMTKLDPGKDEEVFTQIGRLVQIKEASATYGAYDLLVKVEFKTIEELDRFIFDVVRRIPGVTETVTMVIAKTIVE